MKPIGILTATLAAFIVLLSCLSAQASIVTFGSGSNTFQMEFVPIGSPNNAADTTGNPNPAGAVSYSYNLGKFEVSEDMINKANTLSSLGITIDTRGPNQPATSANWYEAAKFVNWLNTSQGFHAAYNFDGNGNFQLWTPGDAGYDANNLYRNSLANYVLPTTNEWYKGAYYDPTTSTYYDYPTGSNTAPTSVSGGTTAGTAVHEGQAVPADIMNAGGLSPFGTMGQGGNVYEWEETATDLVNNLTTEFRGVRGGGYAHVPVNMSSSKRDNDFPEGGGGEVGFRVASLSDNSAAVPEPASLAIWGLGALGCAMVGYRRRKVV